LPALGGAAFLAAMREEGLAPGARIVLLCADGGAQGKSAEVQADATLRKPFDLDALQDMVRRLLKAR